MVVLSESGLVRKRACTGSTTAVEVAHAIEGATNGASGEH